MNIAQSAPPAVPLGPEANPQDAAIDEPTFAQLPAALPGQRTAMRLLDVIDKVARHLEALERRPMGSSAPVVTAAPDTTQLLKLQQENATLRARQEAAKNRLLALLQRVQAAPADEAPENTGVAA